MGMTRDELDEAVATLNANYPGTFEVDAETYRGGDFVITIYHGETDEGAPLPVHAIYNDIDATSAWLLKMGELEPEALEAELEPIRDEYNLRVAAGWGEWVRGDNIISAVRAKNAARNGGNK